MLNSRKLLEKPKQEYDVVVLVTFRGLLLQGKDFHLIRKLNPGIMKLLVITHDTFVGKERHTKSIALYKEMKTDKGSYYLISRFIDLQSMVRNINIIKKYKIPEGNDIKKDRLQPGVDPTDNQQKCIDYMLSTVYCTEKIEEGLSGCIFVMTTGGGKTYMGGAFIEQWHRKTLIIVPKTSPIEEWTKMLQLCFPNIIIGQYHSKAPKTDGDVVIMTIDSALMDTYVFGKGKDKKTISFVDYFRSFGAVIFDEIHNYSTTKRQEVFWRTNFKYALGLTATPDERSDGMDPVASAHVGNIVNSVQIPGFKTEEIKWLGEIKAIQYSGPPEYTVRYTNSKGWLSTKKMCDQFIEDPYRNELLIQEISALYEDNKNVFVFSERREYLTTLQSKLAERGLIAEDLQTLMGGATSEDFHNARNRSRIILITYGYGTEGISIDRMDAMVFATPRKSKMRQALGRILRRSGDPSVKRIIVDIIDYNTGLKKQFYTRKKVYDEKGVPINTIEVSYEDI
jgi:superfamily II DNA or RNA helicase